MQTGKSVIAIAALGLMLAICQRTSAQQGNDGAANARTEAQAGHEPAHASPDKDELAADPLPWPTVTLAPINGDDEDAYRKSIAARIDELANQAHEAENAQARVHRLLAAANLVLAYQIEPACTTALLGYGGDAVDTSEKELGTSLDRADAFIEQAATVLASVPARPETRDDDPAAALRRDLETLASFAQALRAYLLRVDEAEMLRAAASKLSILLESEDREIAAAAALWQGALRSRHGDPARAAAVLDMPLADPLRGTLPFAFYGKLLRCRLRADQGGYIAALALLAQIEEQCELWLSTESDRADARRAAALVEMQILLDWYKRSASNGDAKQQQWCAEQFSLMARRRFGSETTVYRLSPAVPIIVPERNPDGRSSE